jgi:hypothetical protein
MDLDLSLVLLATLELREAAPPEPPRLDSATAPLKCQVQDLKTICHQEMHLDRDQDQGSDQDQDLDQAQVQDQGLAQDHPGLPEVPSVATTEPLEQQHPLQDQPQQEHC